jgi:hypothetical protein
LLFRLDHANGITPFAPATATPPRSPGVIDPNLSAYTSAVRQPLE